jgi:DNA primase
MISSEEIKQKAKIEEVIEDYITIQDKSRADDYRCICPFHDDTKPSMSISLPKQLFYCYGCGKGGDVYKFLSYIENITFKEAVQLLAKKLGIELGIEDVELLGQLRDYWASKIHDVDWYLEKRKIYAPMVEGFSLGFAGSDIFAAPREFGTSSQKLVELGIFETKYAGTPHEMTYCKLSSRLIFPIDTFLGTVSFAGRTTADNDVKYWNTPDSKYFRKGDNLFAFGQAVKSIREQEFAYIVEGQLDVVRSHYRGYTNTVGKMGSALTLNQAKLLKRYCNKVVLVYDNDNAGHKALLRSAETCMMVGLRFDALFLENVKDPDDYLLSPNNKFESLERSTDVEFVQTLFEKEEIVKILNEMENPEVMPKAIVEIFNINLDLIERHPIKSLIKPNTLFQLNNVCQIAILLEQFPDLRSQLNDDLMAQVEEERNRPEIINMIFNGSNIFKKVKNPEKILRSLLNEA